MVKFFAPALFAFSFTGESNNVVFAVHFICRKHQDIVPPTPAIES